MTETPETAAQTDARTDTQTGTQLFDRRMLEALVCPESHRTLRYDAQAQELISESANLAFPIRNGIPILLVDEARTL